MISTMELGLKQKKHGLNMLKNCQCQKKKTLHECTVYKIVKGRLNFISKIDIILSIKPHRCGDTVLIYMC